MAFSAGDLVSFTVSEGTRHGGVVMKVEDGRCLLALRQSNLQVLPWLHAGDAGAQMIGLAWIGASALQSGQSHCQTELVLSRAEVSSLQRTMHLHQHMLETVPDLDVGMVEESKRSSLPAFKIPAEPRANHTNQTVTSPFREAALGHPGFNPDVTLQLHPEEQSGQYEGLWDADAALASYLARAFEEGMQALKRQEVSIKSELDLKLGMYCDTIADCCSTMKDVLDTFEQDTPKVRKLHSHSGSTMGINVHPSTQEQLAINEYFAEQGMEDADRSRSTHGASRPVTFGIASSPSASKSKSLKTLSERFPRLRTHRPTTAGNFDYHADVLQKIGRRKRWSLDSGELHGRLHDNRCCHWKCHSLVRLVKSLQFNIACSLVTVLFAMAVGFQADVAINSALAEEPEPAWPTITVHVFNVFFGIEVIIRILAYGIHYFVGPEWRWNCFDLFLVILSIVDILADGMSVGFMRVTRALKVIKAVRIVRVFRVFNELRLMVAQVLTSMACLFWSLAFLFIFTYLCSIAFLQAASSYVRQQNVSSRWKGDIETYYSSVGVSMYTLIGSITSGVDWMNAAEVCWELGVLYGVAFMTFVLVSILGILNVVTSIFVERASNMKRIDRDFAISEELRTIQQDIKETVDLFHEIDINRTGEVNLDSFLEFLTQEHVIAHFAMFGIDVTDRDYVISVMDHDDTGSISVEKFVHGCVALKGGAKKSDTAAIVVEIRRAQVLTKRLEKRIDKMNKTLSGTQMVEPEYSSRAPRVKVVPKYATQAELVEQLAKQASRVDPFKHALGAGSDILHCSPSLTSV